MANTYYLFFQQSGNKEKAIISDNVRKIGLLADSHGKLEALKAAVATLNKVCARTLVHLGDIFDSLENDNLYDIYQVVKKSRMISVKGNNDFQIQNLLNSGKVFNTTIAEKNELLAFLKNMPMLAAGDDICFSHSLPFESIRSFYEPIDTGDIDRAKYVFDKSPYRILFCGHSHSSVLFRWREGRVSRELIKVNKSLQFQPAERYIVIVGSTENGECGFFDRDLMRYYRICFTA